MTAIAALAHEGKIYMGGDSAAVGDGHHLTIAATPKVFELGPLVIGYTSSFAMGYALQHRLKLDFNAIPNAMDLAGLDKWMATAFTDAVRQVMRDCGYMKVENAREQGGVFLVGVRGQIYYMDDDFHARREAAPYAAIGSGVSVCLGALNIMNRLNAHTPIPAEHQIRHALEAAEAHIATVRGPFHVITGGAA